MHATKRVLEVDQKFVRKDLPEFSSGDTVRVHARIVEGEKERIQIFEGVVMAIAGSGPHRTFRVRKISGGTGVEIVYPISSPKVAKVEVVGHGKVRRSRLYYVRELTGKAARIKGDESKLAKRGLMIPVTAAEGAKPAEEAAAPTAAQ